jgi:hypothetical protein
MVGENRLQQTTARLHVHASTLSALVHSRTAYLPIRGQCRHHFLEHTGRAVGAPNDVTDQQMHDS